MKKETIVIPIDENKLKDTIKQVMMQYFGNDPQKSSQSND